MPKSCSGGFKAGSKYLINIRPNRFDLYVIEFPTRFVFQSKITKVLFEKWMPPVKTITLKAARAHFGHTNGKI